MQHGQKIHNEPINLIKKTGNKVLDIPGLGIEIDENEANKHHFRYWETPHLYRKDGSLTNW